MRVLCRRIRAPGLRRSPCRKRRRRAARGRRMASRSSSLLRRLFAIARAVVGVEAVWRAVIDVEFGGLAGGLELSFHLLDLLDLDAGVLGPVEAKHGRLHVGSELDRASRHGVALVDETAV